MNVEDIIAKLTLDDLKNIEAPKATVSIEIDLISMELSVITKNVNGLSELVSFLQYCVIENLKAARVSEEDALSAFNIGHIVSQGYAQPKYLTLNGKNFREEK